MNVLPSSTGIVGVGRFTNSTPNSYGTNYGLLINVSGAQQNIGIVSNGAVVCNSYITDYGISKLTPVQIRVLYLVTQLNQTCSSY